MAIMLHRRGFSVSTIAKFWTLPPFIVMCWVGLVKRDTDRRQPDRAADDDRWSSVSSVGRRGM